MPFRPIQWARRSVEGRQIEADGSRLLNFFAVQLPDPEESKVPVMLYSSPGRRRFLKTNGNRKQANYVAGVHALLEVNSVVYGHWLFGISHQNVFFAIRADPENSGAHEIDEDYDPFAAMGADAIETFPLNRTWAYSDEESEAVPADEPTRIVGDGRRLIWTTPDEVFAFDLKRFSDGEANPFATVTAPVPADLSTLEDLTEQDWVDCEWVDSYFILAARSGQFFHSNVDSLTFDQLDFAEAGANPDRLVAVRAHQRRIYLFGDQTIETWYNAGAADFAFRRYNDATFDVGCAAKATIAKSQFHLCFLGHDLIVYALSGGRITRASSEAVEYDIGQSDPSMARGFSYTEEGHTFYSLTLRGGPADESGFSAAGAKNWTLDFTTGIWHERSETSILCHSRWNKTQNIVGLEGAEHIFDMRLDWGQVEDDDPAIASAAISREAISPLLFANWQRVNMQSFQIDIPLRSGGLDTDYIVIDWNDDGRASDRWKGGFNRAADAQTPATERQQLLSSGPRLRRRRMGQFKAGRHIRLRTSAERRVDILGAYVETTVLPD